MTKPSYLPTIVSVSFLLAVLTSFMTVFWCDFVGGCKLGKYEAEVTLTDAKTQEPLANRQLTPIVSTGTPSLTNNSEEGKPVITDSEGQASIEFNRIFYSRLAIEVFSESPKARVQFEFNRKDIRENITLTQIDTEYLSAGGAEKGKVKLLLEIGDWSLGSAQVGTIEE
jgi:hypothetical protein